MLESCEGIPGYGQAGVPKAIREGMLWEYLVSIAEGAELTANHNAHKASWRFRETYYRYHLAHGYAVLAGQMARSEHNTDEFFKVRQEHLDQMRQWYCEFVNNYLDERRAKRQQSCGIPTHSALHSY